MAETFKFELVSPEKLLLSQDVWQVVIPGTEGDFAVMPGHAPVLSTMRPGMIEIHETTDDTGSRYFVVGGFAEASPTELTILAEEATAEADLDRDKLELAIKNATDDLGDATTDSARTRAQESLDHLNQILSSL
ncbi:MAG: F0F1 ATP synthase subunit epsilon [Hyphomicrobiales bacterium]